jgi:hypothetical protein
LHAATTTTTTTFALLLLLLLLLLPRPPLALLSCCTGWLEGSEEGAPRVFLASLKAVGLGTNLTAASHVHMMDPWWNPAVEDQAMVCYNIT